MVVIHHKRSMSVLSTRIQNTVNKDSTLHAYIQTHVQQKSRQMQNPDRRPKRQLQILESRLDMDRNRITGSEAMTLQSGVNRCAAPSTFDFLLKLDCPTLKLDLIPRRNLESMHLLFS